MNIILIVVGSGEKILDILNAETTGNFFVPHNCFRGFLYSIGIENRVHCRKRHNKVSKDFERILLEWQKSASFLCSVYTKNKRMSIPANHRMRMVASQCLWV